MKQRLVVVGLALALAVPSLVLAGHLDLPGGEPPNNLVVAAERMNPWEAMVLQASGGSYSVGVELFDDEGNPVVAGDWTAELVRGADSVPKAGNSGTNAFTVTFTAAEVGALVNTSAWDSLRVTQVSSGLSGFVNVAVSALAKNFPANHDYAALADDLDGTPTPLLFLGPTPNPAVEDNGANSVTLYNDANANGIVDAGEAIATTPRLNPVVRTNPDGSRTLFNDVDENGVEDGGEHLADVPGANPKVRDNGGNSKTLYDDANDDNVVDPGEEILTTPPANPKVRDNGDGTLTLYNDTNDDGVAQPDEEIATTPGTPTSGSQAVGPVTVTWDFTAPSPNAWSLSYVVSPPVPQLVIPSQGLFCAPFDLNELHPLPRGDLDGDGISDLAELGAGSNPLNTNSNSLDKDGDGTVDFDTDADTVPQDQFPCDPSKDHEYEYTHAFTSHAPGETLSGHETVTWSTANLVTTPTQAIAQIVVTLWRDANGNGVINPTEVCATQTFNGVNPGTVSFNTFPCNDNTGYRLRLVATDDDNPNPQSATFDLTGLSIANEPVVTVPTVADADGLVDRAGSFSDAVTVTWDATDPAALAMEFQVCLRRLATPTPVNVRCVEVPEGNLTGARETLTLAGLRGAPGVLDSTPNYVARVTAWNVDPSANAIQDNISRINADPRDSAAFGLFHNDAPTLANGLARQTTADGRYLLATLKGDRVAFCVELSDLDSMPATVNVTVTQDATAFRQVATLAPVSECFDAAPERPAPLQPNPPTAPPLTNARYEGFVALPAGTFNFSFATRDGADLNGAAVTARDPPAPGANHSVLVEPEFDLSTVNPNVTRDGDNSVTVWNDADRDGQVDPGETKFLVTPPNGMFVRVHRDVNDDGLPDHVHVWDGTQYQQHALPSAFPATVAEDVPCGLRFGPDADGDARPDDVFVDTCDVAITDPKHLPDSVVVTKTLDGTGNDTLRDPPGSQLCCIPNPWLAVNGDPLAPSPQDPDRDGYTTGQENVAGTNPNDAFSNPSDSDADLLVNLLEPQYVDMRLWVVTDADGDGNGTLSLLPGTKYVRVYRSTLPTPPRGPLAMNLEIYDGGAERARLEVYAADGVTKLVDQRIRGDHVALSMTGNGASVTLTVKDGAGATVLTVALNRAALGTPAPLLSISAGTTSLELTTQPFDLRRNGVGSLPPGAPRVGLLRSGGFGDEYALQVDENGDGSFERTVQLTDNDGDYVPEGLEPLLCAVENQNTGRDGSCAGPDDWIAPWEA